jgi:HK97 family phage prohead protease
VNATERRAASTLRGHSAMDLRFADGKHRASYRTKFEVRQKANSAVEIEAYASVYDQLYEMHDLFGEYDEVVRQGAGAKTLSENPPVQLLGNHEGLSLAYTKAGTLKLSEDATGLHWAATGNMARTDVRNIVLAVEDGNIDECSFAFRCVRQEWSPDYMQRDIIEYSLHKGDVSLVNFGANPHTAGTPALREFDHFDEPAARALYELLGRRLAEPTEPDDQVVEDEPAADLSLYRAKARLLTVG